MKKWMLAAVIAAKVSWWLFADSEFVVTQYNLNREITSISEAVCAVENYSTWISNPKTRTYDTIAFAYNLPPDNAHFYEWMRAFPLSAVEYGAFALTVTGCISIPEAGDWTFACGSDDGFKATIGGHGVEHTFAFSEKRSFDTSLKTFHFDTAGKYALRIIYFNKGFWGSMYSSVNEAGLEVSVAQGAYSSFNSSAFHLVNAVDGSVTVSFNANGGNGTIEPQTFDATESYRLPAYKFSREGYIFLGWAETKADADNGFVKYRDEALVTIDHDMTLYAVWGKHYSAPTNLEATQYHNQHPQGVKLTWSPVAGAPGYVILRKIVGENEFYPVGATPDTEYINKVATIPNVKDFKAQYAVAVADWQGNDPNTIVYLSPWSKAEWGCWREDPPPTVEHRPPRVIGMVKSNANPMLSGVKGANVYTIEFNDDYDKSGYVFKQARITGVGLRNGKRYDFTSATRSVTVDIPAGEHGLWSFEGRAVFTETASGKEYTTEPPYILNDKVRFDRAGHDGVKVSGVKVWGSFDKVPNWFKYWKRDGALSSLRDVYYDGCPWYDINKAGSTTGGQTSMYNGRVYILDNAIREDYSSTIEANGEEYVLHTPNAFSLLKCAEVVKHELGHQELWKLRGNLGRNRQDWLKMELDWDEDGLPNTLEKQCTVLPFDYLRPDTFNFIPDGSQSYSEKDGDEEVYVRYFATFKNNKTYFEKVMNPNEDYSWEPGDAPVRRGKAMLASSVESSLATSSAEAWNSGALDDVAFFSGVVEDGLVVVQGVKSITTSPVNSGDYSSLDICVTCAASTNMPCVIVASLSDENGEPVAWASWTGYVDEGENDVTLKIDGSVLRESGKNGYTVASVSVFDIRSIELMEPIAYAAVNYVSPTRYKWSDFRTDNVTIQSLALLEADGRVRVDAEIVVPNEDGVYDLSSYLCDVGTHDYVAEASQTNVVLHAGTNAVSFAFANSDIQMNAVSNAFAISKFTVEKDGEIVAAYNGDATLNVADETILNPTNAVLVLDEATVTNELVAAGGGVLYSGVNFAFDVENSCTNAVDYTLTAYLNSTNSLTVDMATFDLSLTSGVNRITIPFLGAKIKESEIDGPYVLSMVRLESKDDAIASQTLRMDSRTEDCTASDFQGGIITRLVGISRKWNRDDSIVANITFETVGAVSGIVTASLVDAEDRVILLGSTGFVADCAGAKNVEICFAVSNITESAYTMPLRVTYISVEPSDKLLPSLADDMLELAITELNYLEPIAAPMFAPVTKTVFFSCSQPVVISCATPGAEIRYTLDGSEPTVDSALYEGSLVISSSVTVKAKAFAEGMSPSETAVAEYVHAAIVGENLVQNTSPGQGETQTLSIPVPGTYRVSFDYTQGGDVELRMVQGGVTNTLAVVSVATAGSTNFLVAVSAVGDYELTVCDLSSSDSLPSDVSNLNISIPNTPENRSRYWIYETENTFGFTGEWVTKHGFQDGKMLVDVEDNSTFTPYTKSDGRFVTIVSTLEFDSAYKDDYGIDCKCALSIYRTMGDALVFRVLTMENGVRTWKTVGAEGLAEPVLHTPYTLKFTIDCTNRTYSAAIVGGGNVEFMLTHGTTNEFAFAGQQDTSVQEVCFVGTGNVISLLGSYRNSGAEFMHGDVLPLADGQSSQALTESQAAWLNSMKGYDAVKAKVATMGRDDFNDAYLLNLDISQSEFGLGMFKMTGIEVTEDEVRISVTLNRAGAIQVSRGGTSRAAPINGLLKLYGGETPSNRTLLNATIITDDSFSSGDTEVFTYPRSGPARFFCPAIVSP